MAFPVIDVKGEIPSRERVDQAMESWGQVPGYLRLFGIAYGALVTGQPRAQWEPLRALPDDELLREWRRRLMEAVIPSSAEVVARLRTTGVERMVIQAMQPLAYDNWDYRRSNDEVGELARQFPDFVYGFANVNVLDGEKALAEVRRAHRELGLIGLKITTPFFRLCVDDAVLKPFYALCEELGLVVWLHCGVHWRAEFQMDATHPIRVDRVAGEFPKLKIIAGHAGWPWVLDAVLVAWRQKNVYLDISAHRHKHFSKPGSGWEPLLQFGDSTIRRRVLFASTWDLIGVPLEQVLSEFQELPLKPETLRAWAYDNAAALFQAGAKKQS